MWQMYPIPFGSIGHNKGNQTNERQARDFPKWAKIPQWAQIPQSELRFPEVSPNSPKWAQIPPKWSRNEQNFSLLVLFVHTKLAFVSWAKALKWQAARNFKIVLNGLKMAVSSMAWKMADRNFKIKQ